MAHMGPMERDSQNGFLLPVLARFTRRQHWPLLNMLDRYEHLFRNATGPLIIILFLIVGLASIVNIHTAHLDMIERAKTRVSLTANMLANTLLPQSDESEIAAARRAQALLNEQKKAPEPHFLTVISNRRGQVIASTDHQAFPNGDDLGAILGDAMPLMVFGARAGVMDGELAGGRRVLVTVRELNGAFGQVAVAFPYDRIWSWTWERSRLATIIFISTDLVMLMLGLAFIWQSWRLNESETVNKTTRERLEAALKRGRCGLWDWDIAHGRVFWSASMGALLGLPAADRILSFNELTAMTHPDDADLLAIAQAISAGSVNAIDQSFRMRAATGDWIWVRARGEVSRQESSRPHLVGIAVDITEQKRMAAHSEAADERLRDAIDAISEAFVLWDSKDRLVMCNRKFMEMHQLGQEKLATGRAYADIIGREDRFAEGGDEYEQPLEGVGRSFEAKTRDKRWFAINERRTKDGGYVSVGTDISTIKQHEERLVDSERTLLATVADLRRSRKQLETQAGELVELARRYSEEKNRAEQASEAKSRFLATMSHELRTPLNAIIGFSEIMESGTFGELGSERYRAYCHDIHSAGHYLLEVINDILHMSRIEAGRFAIECEDVDIHDVVDECVRISTERAREKNIDIAVDIDEILPLRGDRRSLKQIMLNLMSNATKFTPEGGQIMVRARAANGNINIAIADNGIGIPKHAISKLGRPFEQVENQYSRSYQGSGLGLAISRSLAELHGGLLRIRSTEGKGTVVVVRLPQAGPDQADQDLANDDFARFA